MNGLINTASLQKNRTESTFPLSVDSDGFVVNDLPDYLEIETDDIEFYERCGNGSYGCVYRGKWISRNREVAVKKLLQLENEANLLSKLSHKNIIKFVGVVSKAPNFCLVTEYASNGSLQAFIHSHNLVEEYGFDLILEWALDIALGVHYLHEEAPLKIIHRDLKSTNVVITHDLVCKICDFGTFPWMAPEIIQGKLANEKCDIWSFGVVLWELVTGELPFKGLESFQIAYLIVEREERLPIPSGCPHILSELMKFCWKTDSKERPSFKQILGTLEQIYSDIIAKEAINRELHTYKPNWEAEIEQTFGKLKKIEQDLCAKEKLLDERERKLREEEIKLINNFKIITIEDYDVKAWREVDVYEWIRKTGEKVDGNAYAELFLAHNINGESLLKLTKDDLKSIGITSIGHQLHYYTAIKSLSLENQRLRNFPPLKHAPTVNKQISTREVTFCACIGSHIIGGSCPGEFMWKMYFDIYEGDEVKEQNENVLLNIRDVKFVLKNPPFQQICLTKDKVLKPRSIRIEYDLSENTNKTATQNVTITLKDSNSGTISNEQLVTSTSLQSISALISSTHSSVNNNVSDVWKNRTFEDSVQIPSDMPVKKTPDLWSGIVTGKYRNPDTAPVYNKQMSANVLFKMPKKSDGSLSPYSTSLATAMQTQPKYKRHNTVSSELAQENKSSIDRSNYKWNLNDGRPVYNRNNTNLNSNIRYSSSSSNNNNNNNINNNSSFYKNKNLNTTISSNSIVQKSRTNSIASDVFFDIGDSSTDNNSSTNNSVRSSVNGSARNLKQLQNQKK